MTRGARRVQAPLWLGLCVAVGVVAAVPADAQDGPRQSRKKKGKKIMTLDEARRQLEAAANVDERCKAARALGKIGGRGAVEALLPFAGARDEVLRGCVKGALLMLADAVPVVLERYDALEAAWRGASKEGGGAKQAERALGMHVRVACTFADPRILGLATRALGSDLPVSVREGGVWVLKHQPWTDALRALYERALGDPSAEVRWQAWDGLGQVARRKDKPAGLRAFVAPWVDRESDPRAKAVAKRALEAL